MKKSIRISVFTSGGQTAKSIYDDLGVFELFHERLKKQNKLQAAGFNLEN